MRQPSDEAAPPRRKLLVNLGSGPKRLSRLPPVLAEWREFRVDIDPTSAPDLLADLTDLSAINSSSADAVWAAHCIEHLYLHEVTKALEESRRILADDGFLCVIVPDLQSIASYRPGYEAQRQGGQETTKVHRTSIPRPPGPSWQ